MILDKQSQTWLQNSAVFHGLMSCVLFTWKIIHFHHNVFGLKILESTNVKLSINQKYSVFFRCQLNAVLQSAFGLGDLVGMGFSMRPVLGSLKFSPYVLAFTFFLSSFEFLVILDLEAQEVARLKIGVRVLSMERCGRKGCSGELLGLKIHQKLFIFVNDKVFRRAQKTFLNFSLIWKNIYF